jgi:hypothetical protein
MAARCGDLVEVVKDVTLFRYGKDFIEFGVEHSQDQVAALEFGEHRNLAEGVDQLP